MPARKSRVLKKFGIWLGAAVVVGVVLLLLPPVQLQLVKAVAGRSQSYSLSMDHVWAGPWGVEIENLSFELPGAGVQIHAARAQADVAFWRSLSGLLLDIEAAQLSDLDVSLAAGAASVSTENPEPAPPGTLARTGIGGVVRLPRWLAIRALDAEGDIQVSTATGVEIDNGFSLSARSFARASTGTLQIGVDTNVARSGEALAAARVDFDGRATIDDSSLIRDAGLTLELVPDGGGPSVEAALSAVLGEVETVEARLRGSGGSEIELEAALTPGTALDVSWAANLTRGVVAAFARGQAVADIAGSSTGSMRFDLAEETVTLESIAEFRGSGWDVYDPRLAGLGELVFDFAFNGRRTPGVLEANQLDLAVVSDARGELLRIRAEQPLRYEIGEWLVDPQTWGEPALRIRVSELPLSWFGSVTPTITLQSGELSGALEFVRSEERRTELRVVEPLRASAVMLAPVNGIDVPSFDVSIEPRVTLANGGLEATIDALHLTAATGLDLNYSGQAATSQTQWPHINWQGNLVAFVPALQRIVPQLASVSAGVSGALDLDALVLSLDEATLGAESVAGVQVLAVDLAGRTPLHLQLPLLAPDWDAFEPSRAEMRFDRAPIAWVSTFIPELEFRGGELSGRLNASGGLGRGLRLEAPEPLRIEGFVPVYRGIEAQSAWVTSVRPRLDLRTSRTALVLEDLSFESLRGNSVKADLSLESAGADHIVTTLTLEADVAEFAGRSGLHIGALQWRHKATLIPSEQRYTIEELSFHVEDRSGTDIISLEALQNFTVSAAPFRVSAASVPADILRARVSPIRLEQLLPNAYGLDLQGSLPQGEFFGRAEADGALTLVAAEPLVFRDVSVRWGEASLLDRVTASLDYEVSYSGDGLQARSVNLTASGADGRNLLRTSSRVTAPLTNARLINRGAIEFEAYLEPLTRQPVLDGLPSLTSGTLTGLVSYANEDETSLNLSLQLRDAVAAVIGKFADVDLTLEAAGVRGERLSVTLPLRLESREFGVSSLQLDGTLAVNSDGIANLDASLSGERLAVDDLRRLASFALQGDESGNPGGAEADAPGSLTPLSDETLSAIARLRTERDTVPVWTDTLNANARVSLDEIAFSGFGVEGVRGALELAPDSAALTGVSATLFGAELSADAHVAFDSAQPEPYALEFRAAVDALELENVFLAMSPDAVPMAAGHFALTSTLSSQGLNPLDVGLSSQGVLHLTGGDGIFRGLAAHAGTGAAATRVIGILTFSRELRAIGRMLDGLGEIRFDDAEFLLERNRQDRIDLTRLAVRSPQLRISATGALELAPLQPMLLSPLDADLNIAVRGDPEILFDGMGLLEEEPDAEGYRAFTQAVHVGGTPAAPDVTAFWELLEQAAENSRGALGVTLRALNRRMETSGE